MPTYQYSCTSCGAALEAQQGFSDDPLTVCPECQGRLRKVFSAVGVVFKGSGFYRNDSRTAPSDSDGGSSATKSSPSESGKSTGDSGKSTGGSDGSGSTSSTSSSGAKETAKAGSTA